MVPDASFRPTFGLDKPYLMEASASRQKATSFVNILF